MPLYIGGHVGVIVCPIARSNCPIGRRQRPPKSIVDDITQLFAEYLSKQWHIVRIVNYYCLAESRVRFVVLATKT